MESTGLSFAALMVWTLMVINEVSRAIQPVTMNI